MERKAKNYQNSVFVMIFKRFGLFGIRLLKSGQYNDNFQHIIRMMDKSILNNSKPINGLTFF